MSALDVAGILERAGADSDAPEGSQAWALAQVGAAYSELIAAARAVKFDTYKVSSPELSLLLDGRASIAVVQPATLQRLHIALRNAGPQL